MKDGRPDGLRSIETRPWRPERFVRDPSDTGLISSFFSFGDGEHRLLVVSPVRTYESNPAGVDLRANTGHQDADLTHPGFYTRGRFVGGVVNR